MRLPRLFGALAASLIAVSVLAAPATAVEPAAKKKPCPITLNTDLGWNTDDPGFVRVAPQATWTNCKGRIERVLLTTRILKADGSPLRDKTIAYFPARTGAGTGAGVYYQQDYAGFYFELDEVIPDGGASKYVTTCDAIKTTSPLRGAYWYTTAQALDAKGKVIKQAFGPKHLCGQ